MSVVGMHGYEVITSIFTGQCHMSLGYGMQLMIMAKEEPP